MRILGQQVASELEALNLRLEVGAPLGLLLELGVLEARNVPLPEDVRIAEAMVSSFGSGSSASSAKVRSAP